MTIWRICRRTRRPRRMRRSRSRKKRKRCQYYTFVKRHKYFPKMVSEMVEEHWSSVQIDAESGHLQIFKGCWDGCKSRGDQYREWSTKSSRERGRCRKCQTPKEKGRTGEREVCLQLKEHWFDQKLFFWLNVSFWYQILSFFFQRDRLKALIAEKETKLSSQEKRLQQVDILCITSNIQVLEMFFAPFW